MGSALLTLGKVDEGVSMLQKAIEIDPTQHDVLVNLGTHLQEEGDLDGAKALYTRWVVRLVTSMAFGCVRAHCGVVLFSRREKFSILAKAQYIMLLIATWYDLR